MENFMDTMSYDLMKKYNDSVEQIRYYKLRKLVEEHRNELPAILTNLISIHLMDRKRESIEAVAHYMSEHGFEWEFQIPQNMDTNFNGDKISINLNVNDYKLVLKKTLFKV